MPRCHCQLEQLGAVDQSCSQQSGQFEDAPTPDGQREVEGGFLGKTRYCHRGGAELRLWAGERDASMDEEKKGDLLISLENNIYYTALQVYDTSPSSSNSPLPSSSARETLEEGVIKVVSLQSTVLWCPFTGSHAGDNLLGL